MGTQPYRTTIRPRSAAADKSGARRWSVSTGHGPRNIRSGGAYCDESSASPRSSKRGALGETQSSHSSHGSVGASVEGVRSPPLSNPEKWSFSLEPNIMSQQALLRGSRFGEVDSANETLDSNWLCGCVPFPAKSQDLKVVLTAI